MSSRIPEGDSSYGFVACEASPSPLTGANVEYAAERMQPRSPLSARTYRGVGEGSFRLVPGDLLPSSSRIEILRVAAAQHLERAIRVFLEVDHPLRVLMREPVRGHKIGYEDLPDLVAVLVVLDWIADLTCPERAPRILVGAVEPGIDRHFAQFVCGADADAGVGARRVLTNILEIGSPSLVRS